MIPVDLPSVLLRNLQALYVDPVTDVAGSGGGFGRFFTGEPGEGGDAESLLSPAVQLPGPEAIEVEVAQPEKGEEEAAAPDAGVSAGPVQPAPDPDAAVPATIPPAGERMAETVKIAPKAGRAGGSHDASGGGGLATPVHEELPRPGPAGNAARVSVDQSGSVPGELPEPRPERPAGDVPDLPAMKAEEAETAEPVGERLPGSPPPERMATADRPQAVTPAPAAPAAASPASGPAFLPAEADPGWRLGIEPATALPRDIPAPPPPAPAAPPAAVTNQLVMAIRAGEGERIEIRLDPPELGRVQIEMRSVENTLHALVVAERPEIGDLLRRHAEMLQRDLEAAGYASVSLEFAAGREDEGDGRRAPAGGSGAPLAALAPDPAPPARAVTLDRLDIRL